MSDIPDEPAEAREPRVHPDDERADEPVNYIVVGLLAIPMLAFGLAAIVVPPAVVITLIAKGLSRGNTAYIVSGGILGALWLLMLYGYTKSLFGKPKVKHGSVRPRGM